jgi:hypothetical protein
MSVNATISAVTEKIIERALQRIAAIRDKLGAMELLCSGTLLERMIADIEGLFDDDSGR